ncbi:putative leucine-rich repeat receptor-like protein kinase [Camellia lanceoleosa]|uniref:Leucine-rich repeat receptor-like protein kinase n=1 Tax=Camellia lanceoleosa TaxID=1840588 RepID=A0ACC0IZM8_9ERIC|nr:putative leucine-rich repeat receptor-like protein kinase [Camellia lanceoleosa]
MTIVNGMELIVASCPTVLLEFLHHGCDSNNYNAVQLPWSLDLSLIAQLQELQHLELRGIRIGSLVAPEGCNLNHQSNDHGIPSFILTQHTLQTLDLSSNSLTGSIPVRMLHNVSSVLRLRSNMFSGNFPQGYRNVVSPLVELDTSCNHFGGPLPLNIDALFPKLYNFNVSTNRLNGTIPPSFGELTNLQHLDLSNNQLVGKVPRHLTEKLFVVVPKSVEQ